MTVELRALDSNFQLVGNLSYFNLQWNREYYTVGTFSVQVAVGAYKPSMVYLYTPDRPETGIIQKVELTETVKGRFVQITGYFLEAILNDKIVYPTYYASGAIPSAVVAMLRQYKDDIPLLTVADAPATQADETSWQETGGQLADVAYTKLQTVQHSLRCRYDYLANTITAEVWQGLDRTQEQTVNPFVTFSDGFGNLTEVDASKDTSNYKNYAVVVGQDQAENRKVAYADLSGGGYKRTLYVDARSERWDPSQQTEEEYLAGLQQLGLDKLLDYMVITNVDIQAASSGFVYLQDWDLGDRVDATTDLYDSYTIRTPYDTTGHCERVGYDATTGTATFLVTLTHLEGQAMPGDKITFSLREFLSRKEERTGVNLPADLSAASTAPATQAVDLRGGSGEAFEESSFRALVPNLRDNACPVEGFTLTGLGWVEGKLHVQLLVDDLLDNDNHAALYLTGAHGTVVEPEASYSVWAEEGSGDSYEEYVFSLSPEEAAGCRLTGDFFLSGSHTQGNWKVTFPLEG